MNAAEFDKLFESFSFLKIGVIGDVMLDTYWWGKVERISPEAPVPVVAVSNKEQRIGGAGNVTINVASLGASVSIISVTGNDDEGSQLITLLNQNNINTDYIYKSDDRITIGKYCICGKGQGSGGSLATNFWINRYCNNCAAYYGFHIWL